MLLCQVPDKKLTAIHHGNYFCFVHVSKQDCGAASMKSREDVLVSAAVSTCAPAGAPCWTCAVSLDGNRPSLRPLLHATKNRGLGCIQAHSSPQIKPSYSSVGCRVHPYHPDESHASSSFTGHPIRMCLRTLASHAQILRVSEETSLASL